MSRPYTLTPAGRINRRGNTTHGANRRGNRRGRKPIFDPNDPGAATALRMTENCASVLTYLGEGTIARALLRLSAILKPLVPTEVLHLSGDRDEVRDYIRQNRKACARNADALFAALRKTQKPDYNQLAIRAARRSASVRADWDDLPEAEPEVFETPARRLP